MRECSVPALAEIPSEANLPHVIRRNAAEAPHGVALARKVGGRWVDITAQQFLDEVYAAAKGLIAAGVGPGDRVALMSRTRYEWSLFDFAIWSAGAVTVPVYETSSAEQVEWILADSGAVAAIVENGGHQALVESVRDKVPGLAHLWTIEGADGAEETLAAAGKDVTTAEVDARCDALTLDSIATIIYTSGTTGRPKGCVLTHGNFYEDAANTIQYLNKLFDAGKGSSLVFLPLAHVLGRILHVGCVMGRVRMGHCPDIKDLTTELASFQPTFVLGVPRVFEKVYNSATAKAEADGKGKIFHAAVETAIAYSQSLDNGGKPGFVLGLKHKVFDKLVYTKLRNALGGKATHAISGGAPLGTRLGHFYRGLGFTVLEGYGLTESTGPASFNRPEDISIGTVGGPVPGTSTKIGEDGEILLKGHNIFREYWKNEAATKDAFDEDGWFRTGDLGKLDEKGHLTVTGRKKEILVTAGGKNVAPAMIEDRIRAHSLIAECMVVGDAKPFIAALITIDPETFPAWKAAHGKPADATVADLADDVELIAAVQEAVNDGNKAVSHAEAVKKFKILGINFTEETGHLTPSLKLKRNLVMKDFAGDVEGIYTK